MGLLQSQFLRNHIEIIIFLVYLFAFLNYFFRMLNYVNFIIFYFADEIFDAHFFSFNWVAISKPTNDIANITRNNVLNPKLFAIKAPNNAAIPHTVYYELSYPAL